MSLFVNKLEFGDSILAGGLTLGLLVLPVIIRTTEESLKAVDDTFRQASFGLGASKWETTSKIVFPSHFQISLPD
jgi:phosphate transport system permease protein